MTQQIFENTFAPNSRNKEFTLSQIISGIKHGVIDFDTPPQYQRNSTEGIKKRDH